MVGINHLGCGLWKSMHKAPEISRNMFKEFKKKKLVSQERKRHGNDPRWDWRGGRGQAKPSL